LFWNSFLATLMGFLVWVVVAIVVVLALGASGLLTETKRLP
jgi:hypothetical protein